MKNYVKVFRGHKVPEGATQYQEDTERFHESFWDNDGNVWVIGICEKWVKVVLEIPENLIPLPEEPIPSKAEWVPSGRCIYVYITSSIDGVAKLEEEEVNIIGLDKSGNYVFQNDKSTCYYSYHASEFRPLKTAEEKKREAIKEIVINSIDTSKFKISEMGAIAEFLNQMIDKFDVIPAGDK